MDNVYFANQPDEEIASHLMTKVTDYYDALERTGRWSLWRKSYRAYYNLDAYGIHQGSEIKRGGEQGELTTIAINSFRNLLQHIHVIVTQQRPNFECKSTNMDYKSQVQTILGSNVLEYYMREKRLSEHFKRAVELMLVYGEAFLAAEYDPSAGEIAATDPYTGEVIKTGDVVFRLHSPIDVIRRVKSDPDTKLDWYIIRRYENRYDLIAKHPQHQEKLLMMGSDDISRPMATMLEKIWEDEDSDLVPVYYFVHDRTPACPQGKEVLFLENDTVLESKALSYEAMPVVRMAAYNQDGTSFGYTVAFDLLCIQEAQNMLHTVILSNQAAFGIQNIWMKNGTQITNDQLAGGLNIIRSDEAPQPLNLTSTPAEVFNHLRGLDQSGETISGVNSVARGQPEASLKSGAALALVAAQAVQFANGIQSAYVQGIEDLGTVAIKILQKKAVLPRVAMIVGKDKRSMVKEFTGDDLSSINRVIVDMGSAVSQTIAGRVELANQLLQSQLLKRPEQYIQVMSTGRIEPLTSDIESENLLVQRENELLRDGQAVVALSIDQHVEHIKGHKGVLSDPEARRDPMVTQNALAHIAEHIELLKTTDPALLNALGQAPLGPTPQDQGAAAQQPPMNQPQMDPSQVQAPPGASPEVAGSMPSLPANTPSELMGGAGG